MKKIVCFIFFLTSFYSFAQKAKVAFFEMNTYVKPYETIQNDYLTIVLDNYVKDTLLIQGEDLKSLKVIEFKQSLVDGIDKTFLSSYKDIFYKNSINPSGVTIVIYKVVPVWYKKNTTTEIRGNMANVHTYQNYEVSCQIRYEAAVFKNDQRLVVISKEIMSEKSTTKAAEMGDTFINASEKMVEDLYKESTKILENTK